MIKNMCIVLAISIVAWGQCGSSFKLLSEKQTIKLALDDRWCSDTLQYMLDSVAVSFCAEDIVKECRSLGSIKDKQLNKVCLDLLDSLNQNRPTRAVVTVLLFGGEEFAFRIAKRGRVRVIVHGATISVLELAEYIQNVRNSQCAPDGGTKGIGLFMPDGKLLFAENKGWID